MNKVILIGNLGRDPEIRYTANGQAVASFSIATTRHDKTSDWHRITAFGKTAEIVQKYLKKSMQVCIEGSIQYGKYKNRDGVEINTTDIICNNLKMLGSRSDSQPQQKPKDDFVNDDIPF